MQQGESVFCAIWMVTYNHEAYIEWAIRSVLSQQASFNYKLFIGDDCSKDRTSEICQTIASRYPNQIEFVSRPQNLGPNLNALDIYDRCFNSGAKFVAMLEGDDYWTDPLKLQKQVDFLEQNPGYSICYHRVMEMREDGIKPEKMNKVEQPVTYTLTDLARGNLMHTPSVVFRNHFKGKMPAWFNSLPIGDYPMHILNALQGNIYYMPEYMAVYRFHSTGIWSNLNQRQKYDKTIRVLKILLANIDLPPEVQQSFRNQVSAYTHFLLTDSFTQDSRKVFFKLFIKYWRLNGKATRLWMRTRLKANFMGKAAVAAN